MARLFSRSRSSAGLATRSASVVSRASRISVLAVLGAVFVAASGVTPAAAAPDWDIRFNGRDVSVQCGNQYGRHGRQYVRKNQRKIDFKRGFDAGAMSGFHRGYVDAVNHRDRCPHEYACPGNSRAFRQGYAKSYSSGYNKGWSMGSHACRTHDFGPRYGYEYGYE